MTREVVRDDTGWHDLPDVVLSRTTPQDARLFAAQWTAGGVSRMGHRHITVGEWMLFRLDGPWNDVVLSTPGDLPVVRLLGGSSGPRLVEVSTETAEVVLAPGEPVSSPGLHESALFPDLDDVALTAAVGASRDTRWSVGVLAALGVPTLAAEIHEGREAPESWGSITRVPPAPVAVAELGPRPRTQRGVVAPTLTVVLMLLLAALTVAVVLWMLP